MRKTPNIGLNDYRGNDYVKRENFVEDNFILDEKIQGLEDNKQDKEEGRGLSESNYTQAEKDKLAGIEENSDKTTKQRVLDALDYIPADVEDLEEITIPVTSVNEKIGDVVITKKDINLDKVENLTPAQIREGTTKSHVGLQEVDNKKQMPIKDGTLENYREKLVNLSAATNTVDLNQGNTFVQSPSGNRVYEFTNAINNQVHPFTMFIHQGSIVRELTFPSSVKWRNGEKPDMSEANTTYILSFISVDGGITWYGMSGGGYF